MGDDVGQGRAEGFFVGGIVEMVCPEMVPSVFGLDFAGDGLESCFGDG